MNRAPYGRGDNTDADPYYVRRPMADHLGRHASRPQHEADIDPESGPFFGSSPGDFTLDPTDFGYTYGQYGESDYTSDYSASGSSGQSAHQDHDVDSYWASLGICDTAENVAPAYDPYRPTDPYGRVDPGGSAGFAAVYGEDSAGGRRPSGMDRDTTGYSGGREGSGARRQYSRPDTGSHARVGPVPGRGDYARRRHVGDTDRRRRTVREVMPLWQELPLLLVVAFCLAVLIRTFLLQAFYIPSGSMEDTLPIGNRVLVNKIVYDVREPQRGEIVVFRGTDKWASESVSQEGGTFLTRLGNTLGDLIGVSEPDETDFIKRVIGLPGDTVACCDAEGRVTVNGYPLDEPYVTDNSSLDVEPVENECRSRRFGPVVVESGQLFVMGDHRAVSQDSRCQGTVPIENVIGRAFAVVWPTSDWKGLSVPETFERVPQPLAWGGTSDTVSSSSGQELVAMGWPEVSYAIDCFVPFVWMRSYRRVRRARVRSFDVGSSS